MPENDWIWLKLARLRLAEARFGALGAAQRRNRAWAERCARDAEQRLQRAWEEGALPLRGVPTGPGSHESVEIPASEAGNHWLDCPGSRIFRGRGPGRRRLMDYHSVQVRKTDVERLVAEAGGNQAAASEAQEADTKPQATAPDAQEAGPLMRAVASELRRLFPKGRPALRNDELMERVRKEAGGTLGVFSLRTLERAIALAWPRPKRQRAPKAGKARQT